MAVGVMTLEEQLDGLMFQANQDTQTWYPVPVFVMQDLLRGHGWIRNYSHDAGTWPRDYITSGFSFPV